jgi:hypothetical protein
MQWDGRTGGRSEGWKDTTKLIGALHKQGKASVDCHFMRFEAMKHLALHVRSWIDRHLTSWLVGWVGVEDQKNGLSEIPILLHVIYFRRFERNRKYTIDNRQNKTNRNNNPFSTVILDLRKSG